MTKTLAYWYSSESTKQESSNECQHDRVKMICVLNCALDESSLSTGRVNLFTVAPCSGFGILLRRKRWFKDSLINNYCCCRVEQSLLEYLFSGYLSSPVQSYLTFTTINSDETFRALFNSSFDNIFLFRICIDCLSIAQFSWMKDWYHPGCMMSVTWYY